MNAAENRRKRRRAKVPSAERDGVQQIRREGARPGEMAEDRFLFHVEGDAAAVLVKSTFKYLSIFGNLANVNVS